MKINFNEFLKSFILLLCILTCRISFSAEPTEEEIYNDERILDKLIAEALRSPYQLQNHHNFADKFQSYMLKFGVETKISQFKFNQKGDFLLLQIKKVKNPKFQWLDLLAKQAEKRNFIFGFSTRAFYERFWVGLFSENNETVSMVPFKQNRKAVWYWIKDPIDEDISTFYHEFAHQRQFYLSANSLIEDPEPVGLLIENHEFKFAKNIRIFKSYMIFHSNGEITARLAQINFLKESIEQKLITYKKTGNIALTNEILADIDYIRTQSVEMSNLVNYETAMLRHAIDHGIEKVGRIPKDKAGRNFWVQLTKPGQKNESVAISSQASSENISTRFFLNFDQCTTLANKLKWDLTKIPPGQSKEVLLINKVFSQLIEQYKVFTKFAEDAIEYGRTTSLKLDGM